MVKNIILDVGRVLVAWQPRDLMKKLGFSDETISELMKHLFESGLWNETDRGVMSDEEFLTLAIGKAPEYEREIMDFWNRIDEAIWQFPYTKEWIRSMKEAGYRVYILSNYGSWAYQQTKEKALDFVEEVDGAIFSYQVKMVKPDAEIFDALLDKYELKAEESVFLDDLPANVEGAKAVGIHGIVFTGLQEAVTSLKELGVELEAAAG